MKVFSRPVPTTATSIVALVGLETKQCSGVLLQSPEGNAAIIYFGDRSEQPFELRVKANAQLTINSANDVYIKGTSGDDITIGIL